MSLGQGCFYTYSGFEHCSSAVVGQSRPAVIVGDNPDGTVDVQIFTNGRADGFIQSVVGVQGVVFDTEPAPGGVSQFAARGSTARERQEEQDELARVELARVVAEAEAKQAAERAAAKATEDALQKELRAPQDELMERFNAEAERLHAEETLRIEADERAKQEDFLGKLARSGLRDARADEAKTPPDPVAPEAEQSAPAATPAADPSSTP